MGVGPQGREERILGVDGILGVGVGLLTVGGKDCGSRRDSGVGNWILGLEEKDSAEREWGAVAGEQYGIPRQGPGAEGQRTFPQLPGLSWLPEWPCGHRAHPCR